MFLSQCTVLSNKIIFCVRSELVWSIKGDDYSFLVVVTLSSWFIVSFMYSRTVLNVNFINRVSDIGKKLFQVL